MKRKYFFALLLSVVTIAHAAPTKPNIIFMLADDMGYMDIGANNPKTFYETPNLDALAKRGMRFTSGYAACNVCSPTRASIMTGKYPPRTGITTFIPGGGHNNRKLLPAPNVNQLALDEITIAEALRDVGYTNFIAGKWHLGKGEFSPSAQGFSPDLMVVAGSFFPAGGATDPKPQDDPKFTDRIADDAVKFIAANQDKPFFAYLPFNAVHIPIGARAELMAKYAAKKKTAPPEAFGTEHDCKVQLVQNNVAYAAMTEQLDAAIGRVLAALDHAGIAGRTIVIFMSDNGGLSTAQGYVTSNLPLRGGKGWLYDGGVREPLIIYAPGVTQAGSVCDQPVISTDFYPTILELAGLPLMPKQHVDGVSLLPLLKGGTLARGPLFWHYPHYSDQGGLPGGAVRDGDWKLVEWYEDNSIELYNLRDDPGEKNNLAAKNPAKARALLQMLHGWRASVGGKMPTPNPHPPAKADAPKQPKAKAGQET